MNESQKLEDLINDVDKARQRNAMQFLGYQDTHVLLSKEHEKIALAYANIRRALEDMRSLVRNR